MNLIDRKQAEEIAKKWRRENPEEAKKLHEIFNDEEKLKAWLEKKGFIFLAGVNCPECKSWKVHKPRVKAKGTQYECLSCGKTW